MSRSWVEDVSNLVHIDGLESDEVISLVRCEPLHLRFLRPFLHESVHHGISITRVGMTLPMIDARMWVDLMRWREAGKADSRTVNDAVRVFTARELLRPLMEGLAHFVEFDARPGLSRSMSIPMRWAVDYFVDRKKYPDVDPCHLMEVLLVNMRSAPPEISRKADLCLQPLDGVKSPNLLGYLMVKALWILTANMVPEIGISSDLFAGYAVSYFFDDGHLEQILKDNDTEIDVWIRNLCRHLANRILKFPGAAKAGIIAYDAAVDDGKISNSLTHEQRVAFMGADEGDVPKSDHLTRPIIEFFKNESINEKGQILLTHLFATRKLFRLARVEGLAKFLEGGRLAFYDKPDDEALVVTGERFHTYEPGAPDKAVTLEIAFNSAEVATAPFLMITDGWTVVGAQPLTRQSDDDPNEVAFPRELLLNRDWAAEISRTMREMFQSGLREVVEKIGPVLLGSYEEVYLSPVAALVGSTESNVDIRVEDGKFIRIMEELKMIRSWALFSLACGWAKSEEDLEEVFTFNGLDYSSFAALLRDRLPTGYFPAVFLLSSGRTVSLP